MASNKYLIEEIDDSLKEKKDIFIKKLNSDMSFKSDFTGGSMSFEWLDQIESACPFIDNVVRRPKLSLVQESAVIKMEKTKKITVDSIKDLSRHANYVSKIDEKNDDIELSKVLNTFSEETYNIYENRLLYTLINNIDTFLAEKETEFKNLEVGDNKSLEYVANTETNNEKIKIELKVTSESFPTGKVDKRLQEEIKSAKLRIKRIKEYISSWRHSEMMKQLEKAHVAFINPPIKKTNIILKNPNFQTAVQLWDFLFNYNKKENSKNNLTSDGNDSIKGLLDHSFLIDFFVLDSVSKTKREQKEKLSKYAILMLTEEVHHTISLLLNCGIKISDEELLNMIAKEIKNEKSNRLVGADDVKKKFKNAMEEYLERTQDYL